MTNWIIGAALMGILVGPAAAGPVSIVVNTGQYPSAEAASADAASVKWDDGQDADDIICTESFAAVELQKYLRKMAGQGQVANFAIVDDDNPPADGELILVGNPDSNRAVASLPAGSGASNMAFAALGPEAYMLKTVRDAAGRKVLVVGGRTRVGTLYGAYNLLDRLGVRWFAPGDLGEEVPQRAVEELPALDASEGPAMRTRGFHAWGERGEPEFFDWMARNRMNYWCLNVRHKAEIKKRGIMMNCGNHVLISRYLGPNLPYPYRHEGASGGADLPQDPYPAGPEFPGDVNKDGKLSYSEVHPEWYGLRGGKRSFNIRGDGGDNFCTSNPHAVSEFMKNMIHDLAEGEWQDADSLNFWTLDWGRWCECANCTALGKSTDRNLLLVHRCRQEIQRALADGRLKRDLMVYFLAYADVLEPPTRPLPEGFDYEHCIATYFPIRRCYVHGMADPDCKEYNVTYQKHLDGWVTNPDRHYRGQLFIGEYYNLSGYKCLPVVYDRTMAVDMPHYFSLGARHMHYMHCSTQDWGTKALTNYQFARMLWDPKLDCPALLDDYFAKRYGQAAGVVRKLYENLDKALCNVTDLKYGLSRRLGSNAANLFPQAHMPYDGPAPAGVSWKDMIAAIGQCEQLLAEAKGMAGTERVRARLAEDEGPLRYAANTLRFYDVLVRYAQLRRAGKMDEAKSLVPEAKRLAQALADDKTSVAHAGEHGSAPDALQASNVVPVYQRMLRELAPGAATTKAR